MDDDLFEDRDPGPDLRDSCGAQTPASYDADHALVGQCQRQPGHDGLHGTRVDGITIDW